MPMLAVARAELRAQCLGRSRRWQRCCWRLAVQAVQAVQEVQVQVEVEVEGVNHVTRRVANACHESAFHCRPKHAGAPRNKGKAAVLLLL
jgi:hypothetical protein